MPDDMKAVMLSVFQRHGHMSEPEAEQYQQALERSKRWQVEAWS
jgi:sulfite reductase alpha subunit-like flavoprotein